MPKKDSTILLEHIIDDGKVIQAELSHLNTNYLYVLIYKDGAYRFQVFDLHSSGMPLELEYVIDEMIQ